MVVNVGAVLTGLLVFGLLLRGQTVQKLDIGKVIIALALALIAAYLWEIVIFFAVVLVILDMSDDRSEKQS